MDSGCLIEVGDGSNIKLKSVYFIGSTNITQSERRVVCKESGTMVHGNTSGKLQSRTVITSFFSNLFLKVLEQNIK